MIRTQLRLSESLHDRVKRLAIKENRSINAEIIDMLEREVKRREAVSVERKRKALGE